MNIQDKIKELKDKGETVYSISRLNTIDNCPFEYWQTYVQHLEAKDNIYGFAGGKIHECLENIQNGKEINFSQTVEDMLEEAKLLDIRFPSESIENKWVKDIRNFVANYIKPEYKKVETEKLFLMEINGKYIQGIIDLLIYNEDGTISILDYKTSSKYSNSELMEKGRQLILYGLGMEQLGFKVKEIGWQFLKYVEISYKLKNGNTRTTIAERGFILEKLKSDITKELKAMKKWDGFEIEEMVDLAIENNSFDNLPIEIKNKYTIKDYILNYDFNEENKRETLAFIKAKIEEIEEHLDKESYFTPKEINAGSKFYCENLCNHREHCEYWLEYKERIDMLKEMEENEEIDKDLLNFL